MKSSTLTNQVVNGTILEGIMEKIDNKYEVGDWLIYPKHGLGKAIDYEDQTILKKKTEFLVVFFEQESSSENDSNKINKILNILDKKSFYQNILLLQFSW